jgi:hypothetical protein
MRPPARWPPAALAACRVAACGFFVVTSAARALHMGSEMLQCNDAFLAKTQISSKSRQWGQDIANDPAVAHMRREQVKMREWPTLPASVDVRALL